MLGMIDDFKFEMNKTEFDAISHEISYEWAESKRIGNHLKLQAVGKANESFSFSGILLLRSVNSFDALLSIASKQKPVVLSFINASSIKVVIVKIKRDMSLFLKSGEFVKQGFSVELKRWHR